MSALSCTVCMPTLCANRNTKSCHENRPSRIGRKSCGSDGDNACDMEDVRVAAAEAAVIVVSPPSSQDLGATPSAEETARGSVLCAAEAHSWGTDIAMTRDLSHIN